MSRMKLFSCRIGSQSENNVLVVFYRLFGLNYCRRCDGGRSSIKPAVEAIPCAREIAINQRTASEFDASLLLSVLTCKSRYAANFLH